MSQLLDPHTRFARNPDLVAAEVDGETVMMSIDKGEYYGLNAVGSRIWELLESPNSINALCDQLIEEFDVDAEQCRTEVLTFAGELLEQGVIMPC
ncbi:MAG: lasso peptide biosynthesis PqqD family chaperone [Candidatus Competibacter sp.]|nr:lasso peptide biosynthesis PqqD family chaperone [Candidatus Competibacter sp.]